MTVTGTVPNPRLRSRLYRDGRCVARDFAMVDTGFGLHELAVEDALHEAQRPKLDRYTTHLFLSAYAVTVNADGTRLDTPMREVLNSLARRDLHVVDEATAPYYQDVYDHVLRATEWLLRPEPALPGLRHPLGRVGVHRPHRRPVRAALPRLPAQGLAVTGRQRRTS